MRNELVDEPMEAERELEPLTVVAHKAVRADGSWWIHDNSGLVVAVWRDLPPQAGLYPSVINLTSTLALVDYRPDAVVVIK